MLLGLGDSLHRVVGVDHGANDVSVGDRRVVENLAALLLGVEDEAVDSRLVRQRKQPGERLIVSSGGSVDPQRPHLERLNSDLEETSRTIPGDLGALPCRLGHSYSSDARGDQVKPAVCRGQRRLFPHRHNGIRHRDTIQIHNLAHELEGRPRARGDGNRGKPIRTSITGPGSPRPVVGDQSLCRSATCG